MIYIPDVQDKSFYILGLGKSGFSAALALIASGARIWAWDDNEAAVLQAKQQKIPVCPPEKLKWQGITALIFSPGIPHTLPEAHPVAVLARAHGVPLWCDVELLFQAQKESTFIGITGTNGKSTTTALIAHILRHAGIAVQEGGNLGVPALSLSPLDKKGVYVVELSSFQLELCYTPALNIAIFLNISKNHLERHGGMGGYLQAKMRIFSLLKPEGKKIIGTDSDLMQQTCAVQKGIPISVTHTPEGGVFVENEKLIDATGDMPRIVMDVTDIEHLKGAHNLQNIAAAYAAVASLKSISTTHIIEGIKTFKGLPHRQEVIGRLGSILFVNDSKATTLEAAVKSIRQFENIYWIMGGVAKEGFQDISCFLPYTSYVKKAFLIGKSAKAYAALFKDKVDCTIVHTMEAAVQQAVGAALQEKNPTTVLLAPACASFDQFKNFEDRGEVFRTLVQSYKKK